MTANDGLAKVGELASNTAFTTWGLASDFLIVLILLLAIFIFAWYAGRGPLVSFLLSLYAAYAVFEVFPYSSYLPTEPAMTALLTQVGLFLAFVILFFIILRRVVVSDFLYIGILGLITLSFLGAAFIIALAYHVFPVSEVYKFTPAIDLLFAPVKYFFWWFIAPAIGLLFLAH